MYIAEDIMKAIGVLLIAGLMGCSDDAAELAQTCEPETRECQPGGPQQTSDAGVTPKSISYNALTTEPLMFNALLRNTEANVALTRNSLLLLLAPDPPSESDAEYVQRQLQDPFARRMMEYLVGCALPDGYAVAWHDQVSDNIVTWEGELGLCPEWAGGAISEDEACKELMSACLLARNNAQGVEVLISVRRQRDSGPALALEAEAAGGEPCTEASFAPDCPPEDEGWGPDSDCPGPSGAPYPGRWRSRHIGTCTTDSPVELDVDVTECTGELLFRVCSGISGCDSDSPDWITSTQIPCGTTADPIEFTCREQEAFTLMYANADPKAPAGKFEISRVMGAVYPASEKEVFRWQEGAFYGNLFCKKSDCAKEVDISLWVEVPEFEGDAAPKVVYHWLPAELSRESPQLETDVYTYSPEVDPLQRRIDGHQEFLEQGVVDDDEVQYRYVYDDVVYGRMYACMSPNWDLPEAYSRNRLCARGGDAFSCAAHSMGRCWSHRDSACQCSTYDAPDPGPSGTIDDWRYIDCNSDGGRWQHPLTVFLNDPCDIVQEFEYPEPGEAACEATPICRQTSSASGPWEPKGQFDGPARDRALW